MRIPVPAVRQERNTDAKGGGVAAGAGLVAGLAAIVASSCCVLPIVFVGLGLGSVAAITIPTLAALRPYLLGAAVLAVVAAWAHYARRRALCSVDMTCVGAPARRFPRWLVLASVVVFLALLWQPWIEPALLPLVR
jgi:mercuric ion transport protein